MKWHLVVLLAAACEGKPPPPIAHDAAIPAPDAAPAVVVQAGPCEMTLSIGDGVLHFDASTPGNDHRLSVTTTYVTPRFPQPAYAFDALTSSIDSRLPIEPTCITVFRAVDKIAYGYVLDVLARARTAGLPRIVVELGDARRDFVPVPRPTGLTLAVTATAFRIGGKSISLARLPAELARRARPDATLVIAGHRRATWGRVRTAMALAHVAGYRDIAFATK